MCGPLAITVVSVCGELIYQTHEGTSAYGLQFAHSAAVEVKSRPYLRF